MIWILLIIIIGFVIYSFTKDTKEKRAELAAVGGIINKYKELINYFNDFDTNNLPKILNNDVNFYQIGWAGATTLASVSLFEVVDKLNIEFELQYNVPALKRNGIEVNSLPPIHKKKTWTYSNSLDQAEIYNSVAKEIEYLCSL
jgi:hypothetical protein